MQSKGHKNSRLSFKGKELCSQIDAISECNLPSTNLSLTSLKRKKSCADHMCWLVGKNKQLLPALMSRLTGNELMFSCTYCSFCEEVAS